MKKIVVSGLLALSLAAAAMPENEAVASDPIGVNPGGTNLATTVYIGCEDPGTSIAVPKTPVLKNTTGFVLKKGLVLGWRSSDGDSGSFVLGADLEPNKIIYGQGKASTPYVCAGFFLSQADLVVKSATAQGPGSVKVDVQNLDPWVGAASSVVRLEVVACSGQVVRTINLWPGAIGPGQTTSISFPVDYPGTDRYLRVTADATGVVSEKNENNNVLDAHGVCVH